MTAKEYLSQARYLDARINTKIKQLEALNTLATSATSVLTGMPHSPNKATSKMADIVDKIVDLQAEINRDIDALVDLKGEMRSKLEMVPAEDYKAILEMRYLCFMSWEQIASNLGLSVPYTYKLHDRALKGFESRASPNRCSRICPRPLTRSRNPSSRSQAKNGALQSPSDLSQMRNTSTLPCPMCSFSSIIQSPLSCSHKEKTHRPMSL